MKHMANKASVILVKILFIFVRFSFEPQKYKFSSNRIIPWPFFPFC